ncbi:MAG: DsbA family protein [Succinivibrio sp.]
MSQNKNELSSVNNNANESELDNFSHESKQTVLRGDEIMSSQEKITTSTESTDTDSSDETENREELTAEELIKKADEEIKEKRVLAAQENPTGKFRIKFRKNNKKNNTFGKFKKAKDGLHTKRPLNFKQFQDKLKEELIISAKWLANKENLKKVVTNKQNIAVGMSALALIVSVSAFINSRNTSPIDRNNPFVKLNEVQNQQLGITSSSIMGESSATVGVDNSYGLDPIKQPPKGLVFNSEKDFKDAVQQALNDIKNDQIKEQLTERYKKYEGAVEKTPTNEKIYGNPDARFKIIEYSDIECPYCKNFFATPKEVVDLSNGQVSLTWKNMPLPFHEPKASQEAVAVECAFKIKGNKAAWVALDKLFEATKSNGLASLVLDNFANEMGLETAKYLNCIADPASIKAVQKDIEQAKNDGISSTPSTVIIDTLTGQKEVLSGAVGADVIMNTIEAMNSNSMKLKPIQTK